MSHMASAIGDAVYAVQQIAEAVRALPDEDITPEVSAALVKLGDELQEAFIAARRRAPHPDLSWPSGPVPQSRAVELGDGAFSIISQQPRLARGKGCCGKWIDDRCVCLLPENHVGACSPRESS